MKYLVEFFKMLCASFVVPFILLWVIAMLLYFSMSSDNDIVEFINDRFTF